MLEQIIFIFFIILFLTSTIGYGYLSTYLINKKIYNYNIGYQGLFGFFSLVIISILTSFFFSHNFVHNTIIHLIGIFSFFLFFKKITQFELKLFSLLFLLLIISAYVYKNHDDFGYYHLTYALNLSENKFIIGSGHFSHGFRTNSSIFFYNSLLYLPFIKFFLFHIGSFFILLFVNFIFLEKILNLIKLKRFEFILFFLLFSITFINIVFYRVGEHGTDRSAQIIVFLIFFILFEMIFQKSEKRNLTSIYVFTIMIMFAASLKALYYIYLILIPYVIFRLFNYKILYKKINLKIIFILFNCFVLNIVVNFFNTGCLLYPASSTCFNTSWSIPKSEVKLMNTHYEWWAKSGGGPGYKHEMKKKDYIKNFVWFENWVDRHFFNKVSDTLFGTIFICLLYYLLFRLCALKKSKIKHNFSILYSIIIIIFLEWFLKHPAMRYGGYVLIGLPLFIFFSNNLHIYKFNNKKIILMSYFLIFLIFSTFVTRNILRINKEILIYKYPIFTSPFFYVEKVEPVKFYENNNFKLFTTNKRMCWATKTPCSYRTDLKTKKLMNLNVILRED